MIIFIYFFFILGVISLEMNVVKLNLVKNKNKIWNLVDYIEVIILYMIFIIIN